jgi:hypothetical protein
VTHNVVLPEAYTRGKKPGKDHVLSEIYRGLDEIKVAPLPTLALKVVKLRATPRNARCQVTVILCASPTPGLGTIQDGGGLHIAQHENVCCRELQIRRPRGASTEVGC